MKDSFGKKVSIAVEPAQALDNYIFYLFKKKTEVGFNHSRSTFVKPSCAAQSSSSHPCYFKSNRSWKPACRDLWLLQFSANLGGLAHRYWVESKTCYFLENISCALIHPTVHSSVDSIRIQEFNISSKKTQRDSVITLMFSQCWKILYAEQFQAEKWFKQSLCVRPWLPLLLPFHPSL